MPHEAIETIKSLKERIGTAYTEKDEKGFVAALKDLYCVLTDCKEVPGEIAEVIEAQVNPESQGISGRKFLDDEHKLTLEVPLAEGGDPHLVLYRNGDRIDVELRGSDDETQNMRIKFRAMGF